MCTLAGRVRGGPPNTWKDDKEVPPPLELGQVANQRPPITCQSGNLLSHVSVLGCPSVLQDSPSSEIVKIHQAIEQVNSEIKSKHNTTEAHFLLLSWPNAVWAAPPSWGSDI